MGGCRCTREVDDSLQLRDFPKENPILTHYMLSLWWLHLMIILGHYIIQPRSLEKVLATKINLGYTYAKIRLKNTPEILFKLAHIVRITAWIPSRLAWTPDLQGRYWSLQCPAPPHGVCRNKKNRRVQQILALLRGTCYGNQV